MILPPPTPTRTDTLFPYTTLCRSVFDGSAQRPTRGILRQFRQIEHQNRTTVGENRRAADAGHAADLPTGRLRSEAHTSELQSLLRISYAVFCLKANTRTPITRTPHSPTPTWLAAAPGWTVPRQH